MQLARFDGIAEEAAGAAGAPPVSRPWYHLSFEERAALVGALGGITFGYDIGVISGALVSLKEDFDLSADAEGLVVAMIAFGQMGGALVGVFLGFSGTEFGPLLAASPAGGSGGARARASRQRTRVGHAAADVLALLRRRIFLILILYKHNPHFQLWYQFLYHFHRLMYR